MKFLWVLAAVAAFAGFSPSYFHYQKSVQISGPGQHYIAVDQSIWQHARRDLGDLRLDSAQTEVPYALITERGSDQRQQTTLSVLQQSSIAGKTQFVIDMSGLAEYDHVDLALASKNFVAHSEVEGSDDIHSRGWASLGDDILYDLTKENLGSNSTLRLPRSTYKYLRVTIDGAVKPDDVTGAVSEVAEKHPPVWRDVNTSPKTEQNGKDTVLTFDVGENIPVERVLFSIDPAQGNFQRNVEIQNESGGRISSGEVNRIHLVRSGRKIDSEVHHVSFSATKPKIKIILHNGDDPRLKLTGVSLQQLERRLYFDAPAQGPITLYYGDEKLDSPVYDYEKLFVQNKSAAEAGLGPETANAAFTGRPDDRPWSEKHPAVLWTSIIVAVLVLGGVALRSMRSAAT